MKCVLFIFFPFWHEHGLSHFSLKVKKKRLKVNRQYLVLKVKYAENKKTSAAFS